MQISARKVKVTGPLGTLTKSFKHIDCDLRTVSKGRKILLEIWFATAQGKSCVNTITSTITNMMVGVTQGYRYKMRFAYAHFPIKVHFPTEDPKTGKKIKEGSLIEIRNFLGEFYVRRIYMRPGVKVIRAEDAKDEIILEGNDLNFVSQTGICLFPLFVFSPFLCLLSFCSLIVLSTCSFNIFFFSLFSFRFSKSLFSCFSCFPRFLSLCVLSSVLK